MSLPRGWRRLDRRFFERDTVDLARALIGLMLVQRSPQGIAAGRIVETEAYLAVGDPASHSHGGRTRRNAAMFASAGTAYVYFIYGMHRCFNVVSRERDVGEAVLVRALEPVLGLSLMRRRRGLQEERALCRGPGNLTVALGITLASDGASLLRGPLGLWSEAGPAVGPEAVESGTRIGIRAARDLRLRFFLRGSLCVSGRAAARRGARAGPRR